MKPVVARVRERDQATPERYTTERCHIFESWNDASDPGLSIARARVEPGVTTALHTLDVDERYFVLSGRGRVEVEGLAPTDVEPGDIVVIPAGTLSASEIWGATDLLVPLPLYAAFCAGALSRPGRRRRERVPKERPLRSSRGASPSSPAPSGGIGAAIATTFARAGASLIVHYHDEERAAAEVAEEIEASGGRALKLGANLRSPGEVERLFEEVERRVGLVNVLVNNAGVYPLHALVDATPEAWQEVIETNLNGVHYCTRSMARRLVDRGSGGAIVNVASIEGLRPAPLHSHYTASKAGVLAYTRSAAVELGAQGIRVNAVSPGLIRREGIEEAWPEGVEAFLARAPLGRLGTAEDVAHACLFLASNDAAFVTGANLLVDGGVLAAAAF